MISKEGALEYLLGSTCSACGAALDGPGEPCTGCGRIPDVTGPELGQHLDSPVALAAVEAAKLRAEAWAMHDAAVARMAEADRAVHMARLQVRKDAAQVALDSHVRAHKSLYGPRNSARKAEEKSAAELAAATADHSAIARAEEEARRYKHGLAAETDAAHRLATATQVLQRYQSALADATVRREQAEHAFDQSAARTELLEKARDDAARLLADPGRIPLSGETITAGGLRLILQGGLDELEMAMAGQTARLVCGATGATADIEADVRRQVAAESEERARKSPVRLGRHDGQATAVANVLHNGQPPAPMPGGQSTAPPAVPPVAGLR